MDAAVVQAADHAARHWTSSDPGPFGTGSDRQKHAACTMFRDTFNPYKPSVIDWPVLDDQARERVTILPICDIAVRTEGRACLRMLSYAHSAIDAEWKEAIAHNGWEEGRHKEVLHNMVGFYGIQLEPEPLYVEPRDAEWAYMVTGFSECIDSFFAIGLFETARRSGLFPPELVDTSEPVMQEECRHIVLFANWLAWQRRHLDPLQRVAFELRVAVWVFLGLERVNMASGFDDGAAPATNLQDNNFTVTGSKAVTNSELTVPDLMALCLKENDRRFSGYDERLLRPTAMPTLVRVALAVIRTWDRIKPHPLPRRYRRPLAAAAAA